MHLLILGASGRTGRLATAEALQRGHKVTALVRQASSIESQSGLSIIQGSSLDRDDVGKTFVKDPVDVVIVALNAARASDSPFSKPVAPPFLLRDSLRVLADVMNQRGVKRVIVMSAFGAASSFAQLPWLTKLLFRHSNMKFQMQDHDATDEEVRKHDELDWTFVRPAMLKEGAAQTVKEHGETGDGALGLFTGITRASVAQYMIQEAENGQRKRQAVVIAN